MALRTWTGSGSTPSITESGRARQSSAALPPQGVAAPVGGSESVNDGEPGELERRLRRFLEAAELDEVALRCDPSGEKWLPRALREAVVSNAAARDFLGAFVATELEMYSSVRESADPLFAARVVACVSQTPAANPDRRTLILATCHAMAAGVAYLLFRPWFVPETVSQTLATVHGLLDSAVDTGLLWGLVAAIALGAWLFAGTTLDRVRVALPRT